MSPLRSDEADKRDNSPPTNGQQKASNNGQIPESLAANAAAAALRDFARGQTSKRSSNSSNASRRSFRSVQDAQSMPEALPSRRLSSRLHSSSSSVTPPSDSPPSESPPSNLSPSDSPPSLSSSEDLDEHSNPLEGHPFKGDHEIPPDATIPVGFPSPPPIPPSRPPPRPPTRGRKSDFAGASTPSRSRTPMTLSDLGRDFSRYPFHSRRSSISFPSTPTPRYSGTGTSATFRAQALPTPSGEATPKNLTAIEYPLDPEKGSSWLLDDRLATATFIGDGIHNFPLYMDEKEQDDDIHNPKPDEDLSSKPQLKHFFQPRQLASLFGLIVLIVGLLCVFIMLPVLSYTGHAIYSYPYQSNAGFNDTAPLMSPEDHVNDIKYPLLKNIRTGLIDPKTPSSALTRPSFDGGELQLVFSDEFQTPNRTFYPGDDPFWTAVDLWYGATQDLDWYDPDAVTTADGTLTIRLDEFLNHGLNYRSGMLNSWNQVCMKGGLLEVSVSLPGPGGASGLWPGIWTLGNLGRPGYKASTEGLWPYTYNSCDAGITPNQSMTDGTSYLPGQKLSACTCDGEDHPTPGTGRGAPEIDVFEASADAALKLGMITQSYQVAPFDIFWQPNYDHFAIPNYNVTQMNGYCGGPFQQALSAQTELNNRWYDGDLYQKYGFEYTPGSLSDGRISWFVGEDQSFMITGNAVGPNGNVDSRPISNEPMSIVLNVGFSTAWTGINYEELRFPTTMFVDYVRWYQKEGEQSVTCDPPGYETTDYIKHHPDAYHNYNLTFWNETGYAWPKNKINSNC